MPLSVSRHDEQAIEAPQPVVTPEPVAPVSVGPVSLGAGLTPSGVISLQRSAGNAATTLHLNSTRPTGNTLGLAQGSEVHLAPGAGDHVLRPELAHIAQQRRGPIGGEVGR